MKLKVELIEYKSYKFIIQSYLKNDFANLCKVNGDSFRFDFVNNTITTSGKETKEWKNIKNDLEIEEIKQIVNRF